MSDTDTTTGRVEAEQQFLASLRESMDDLHDRIAELAYFKAEARGFEAGHEIEDWLAAEYEVRGEASCSHAGSAARIAEPTA